MGEVSLVAGKLGCAAGLGQGRPPVIGRGRPPGLGQVSFPLVREMVVEQPMPWVPFCQKYGPSREAIGPGTWAAGNCCVCTDEVCKDVDGDTLFNPLVWQYMCRMRSGPAMCSLLHWGTRPYASKPSPATFLDCLLAGSTGAFTMSARSAEIAGCTLRAGWKSRA